MENSIYENSELNRFLRRTLQILVLLCIWSSRMCSSTDDSFNANAPECWAHERRARRQARIGEMTKIRLPRSVHSRRVHSTPGNTTTPSHPSPSSNTSQPRLLAHTGTHRSNRYPGSIRRRREPAADNQTATDPFCRNQRFSHTHNTFRLGIFTFFPFMCFLWFFWLCPPFFSVYAMYRLHVFRVCCTRGSRRYT